MTSDYTFDRFGIEVVQAVSLAAVLVDVQAPPWAPRCLVMLEAVESHWPAAPHEPVTDPQVRHIDEHGHTLTLPPADGLEQFPMPGCFPLPPPPAPPEERPVDMYEGGPSVVW